MRYIALLIILLLNFKITAQQSYFKYKKFDKADSIARLYKQSKLTNLPLLAHQLTSNLNTESKKFRSIYMWVCNNIENDYDFYIKNSQKRRKFKNDSVALLNWNNTLKPKVFKKLIKEQKTICTGYAYIIKELALLAGIECKIIHGYGRTVKTNVGKLSIPNHSWNAVKLDNIWYLCDATWASGTIMFEDEAKFVKDYNDGYFFTDPALFVKTHYPLDEEWKLLNKESFTIEQFINAPIIYGHTFKHKIIPIEPKTINNEVLTNEAVLFKFKVFDKNQIAKLKLEVNSGWKNKTLMLSDYKYSNNILQFKHTFNKKGLYDVHLKIDTKVIASYTVKVLKTRDK